jgi:hypothetical protein
MGQHDIMTEEPKPRIVRMPSDEDMKAAFEDYTLALGKVIYAWNYLLGKLGSLFVVVVGDADREILLHIWNVPESDRVKVLMLKAAATASSNGRWLPRLADVREDVLWLVAEANELITARNDAAHGLATLFVDAETSSMRGHPLALDKRTAGLRGRGDLLVEFDRLERWAEGLSVFTQEAESALHPSARYPWPDRFRRPSPRSRTTLQGLRRPTGG